VRRIYTLPHSSKVALIPALCGFSISVVFAVVTNFPLEYVEAKPDDLEAAEQSWNDALEAVEENEAYTLTKVWRGARARTEHKQVGCLLLLSPRSSPSSYFPSPWHSL